MSAPLHRFLAACLGALTQEFGSRYTHLASAESIAGLAEWLLDPLPESQHPLFLAPDDSPSRVRPVNAGLLVAVLDAQRELLADRLAVPDILLQEAIQVARDAFPKLPSEMSLGPLGGEAREIVEDARVARALHELAPHARGLDLLMSRLQRTEAQGAGDDPAPAPEGLPKLHPTMKTPRKLGPKGGARDQD